MQEVNKVLSKWNNKTEKEINLKKQEIELADQLKDFGPEAQSIYLDARNLAQKDLMILQSRFSEGEGKLIKLSNELEAKIKKTTQTAKSIGVDIKETTVYKNFTSASVAIEGYLKSFDQAISKVKSIGI